MTTKSTALHRAELARQPRLKRIIDGLPKHSQSNHFLFMDLRERASRWSDSRHDKVQNFARMKQSVNLEIATMERYDFALSEADREQLQGRRNEAAAYRAAIDEAHAEKN